jgi:regulator of replication initiation timing
MMKKLRNSWTEQTEILEAMRQTLRERQAFISEVIADNVRLEAENKKLSDLIGLLTTERSKDNG